MFFSSLQLQDFALLKTPLQPFALHSSGKGHLLVQMQHLRVQIIQGFLCRESVSAAQELEYGWILIKGGVVGLQEISPLFSTPCQ